MTRDPGNVACVRCLHEHMAIMTSWNVDSTHGKAAVLEGMFICDGCAARNEVVIPLAQLIWTASTPKAGPLEAFTKAVWDDV